MQDVINSARDSLGPAPRSLGFFEWLGLKAWAPQWLWFSNDRLAEVYANQRDLLEKGRVVWGHIVQANSLLFEPGSEDCPAAALYSPSRALDDEVGLLGEIAHGLYELKETVPDDPELQIFARTLTSEVETLMKVKVPPKLTEGHDVYYTCIMVPRKHLPNGFLTQRFFPLLIAPALTQATMILPARYWPPDLVQHWCAGR